MPDRRLTVAYAIVLIGVSTLATVQPSLFQFVHRVPGGDKAGHFLLAGLLAFFAVTAFSRVEVRGRTPGAALCVGVVLILVTADEALQLVVRTRTFSLLDLLSNASGAVAFGWLAARVSRQPVAADSDPA